MDLLPRFRLLRSSLFFFLGGGGWFRSVLICLLDFSFVAPGSKFLLKIMTKNYAQKSYISYISVEIHDYSSDMLNFQRISYIILTLFNTKLIVISDLIDEKNYSTLDLVQKWVIAIGFLGPPIIAPPPPQLIGQITYSPRPNHGKHTILGATIISWGAIMGKTRILTRATIFIK